jgi:hypothetical protein
MKNAGIAITPARRFSDEKKLKVVREATDLINLKLSIFLRHRSQQSRVELDDVLVSFDKLMDKVLTFDDYELLRMQ